MTASSGSLELGMGNEVVAMTRQEVSSRESQSTRSSAAAWFGTVCLAIFAGAALIGWLGLIGATSSASRPPVSYTEEAMGPTIVVGLFVAVLVAAAVWLAVRTVTGRTPSKATTVVLLAASALLIQAAMAGVWELGRRQSEADVRAQAAACSVADVDLLREGGGRTRVRSASLHGARQCSFHGR